MHDGDGIAAAQPPHRRLHRRQQVTVVQAVDQVDDGFGVGLAAEVVAARQQLGAQRFMVFDDAVVHQGDAAGPLGAVVGVRAHAEVRVRVGHRRRAMRGPAGVGDAGQALQPFGFALRRQVGHARDAAGAPQRTGRRAQAGTVHRHAAGVVATVFQPLQALHQDGNDVARGDRADDAAHMSFLPRDGREGQAPRPGDGSRAPKK